MLWKPPEQFEEYELVELIGRGGMGAVYLARDTVLERAVAIKFIAVEADRQARERFLIEARAVARIQHPNVVAIYRIGEVEGRPFIVSELVRGKRLDLLAGQLEGEELLRVASQLARGLAVAHRRGVLHRDLKPENAILAEAGEVKLLDFGIAKLSENAERLSLTRSFVGWEQSTAAVGRETAAAADRQAPTLPGKLAAPVDLDATATMDAPLAPFRSGERADATGEQWWRGAASSADSPTHAGAVMGTPCYIAPEIWGGEPATTRSDVYSLGALLYMLAAGRPPHEGDTLFAIADKTRHEDAAPLAERAPAVPEELAAVVDRCLARDPAARWADGDAVREALEALGAAGARIALPPGNPYRGLAAFEAEHQGLFFGRGREIRAVVERLRASPRVLVAGDSGVGKSSLLRAGVLPHVAQHGLGDGRRYLTMTMVPSRAPWTTFIARLGALLDLDDLEADDDPAPVARTLRRRLGADTGAIVLIDQLEELSTLADAEESALLAEALLVFGHTVPGLRVACTVRADFLTRVSALPGLGEMVDRSLYLLRPMDGAGLREAITGPARALGFSFEDGLVESLAEGAGGGLPLLQFCLAELWEGRDRVARCITRGALDDLGGVHGALSQHADAVIAALRPGPLEAARSVLTRLVSTEGTRQRLSEAELCGDSDDARSALDALVRGRLVTAREAEAGTELEIAHEALIAGWGTLAAWLSEDAGRRAVLERLRAASREWERLGRAREALWQPRQLAELGDLDPAELGDRERAFQAASRAHVRWRTFLRWGAAAAVVLAIAGVYAGVTLRNRHLLEERVDAELAESRSALALARARAAEESERRAQAFALFDRGELERAEATWTEAAALREEANRAYGQAGQTLERAITLDPERSETRALLAGVLYDRALRAEMAGKGEQTAEYLERLELYDDGSFSSRFRAPATVSLTSEPPGASVTLARYLDHDGRRDLGAPRPLGRAPLDVELEPGSYLLTLSADGREDTLYPVRVRRGERLETPPIRLPPEGAVPEGFAYVPAGRFVFGSVVDYSIRDNYLASVPAHEREGGDFLIATTEVTYADYVDYLEALPAAERDQRRPNSGSVSLQGSIELSRAGGRWHLRFQPNATEYRASWGEPIRYQARTERSEQDWRRMPVSGISFADAEAYAAWLAATGRVPGARLCSETEWEHAGRGADGRVFATGDTTAPGDGNYAETYASDPLRFGPDEVGSYPHSRSPFGLHDMSGNVWEMTRSLASPDEPVARGSSFPLSAVGARLDLREPIDTLVSDITLGFRVCADPSW